MSNTKIKIGIDPDTSRSGFVIRFDLKTISFEYGTLSFFSIYDRLKTLIEHYGKECIIVRIDAGWLNKKTNFRQKIKKGGVWVDAPKVVGERIAAKVGRNEEVGRKIVEMCEHLGLKHELVQPTTSKWTAEYLKAATGIETKNQDVIDAFRLVA